MAHPEQREFCERVKARFAEKFNDPDAVILDAGSLDINGNNRWLFASQDYLGIDVGPGRNVDRVCRIHLFDAPDETYDVIISTECFEHDEFYPESMQNITRMLKPGGMFLFTPATTGRPEHGTTRSEPHSAPFTNDYYKNLTAADVRAALPMEEYQQHAFSGNVKACDLYFWGIKKRR